MKVNILILSGFLFLFQQSQAIDATGCGINYYAAGNQGWDNQWLNFPANRNRILKDLQIAKSIGVTFVRTFVQWDLIGPKCNCTILGYVEDFLSLADSQKMKVILGLDHIPTDLHQSKGFLSCLLSRFRDDGRVDMWELRNEADAEKNWIDSKGNFNSIAYQWFLEMTGLATDLTEQSFTISCVFDWNHLIDICNHLSDRAQFVPQMHVYPPLFPTQSYRDNIINGVTNSFLACKKPIFIGEWGRPGHDNWATNCTNDGPCDAANQALLYQQFRSAVEDNSIRDKVSKVSPWTLNEFTGGSPERENYFGVLRLTDYSMKPAALVLKEWYGSKPKI